MRVRRALLSLAIAAASSACALLVPEELGSVSCRDEGAVGEPACARGELCQSGECRRCAPSETCGDGLDNDCDGTADDGCEEPVAGSGGTDGGEAGASGDTGEAGKPTGGSGGKAGTSGKGGTGGKAGAAGKGGTAGKAGAGGSATSGASGASGEGGAAGLAGGGAGATAGQGGSGGPPRLDDGKACSDDAECAEGSMCASFTELGAVGPGTPPGTKLICSRGCRNSNDCVGADAICQPTPGGSSVCVAAADVGRGATGKLGFGQPCTEASQCRSAWCEGSFCRDTCGTSDDCQSAAPNNKCVAEKGIPGAPEQIARRCTKGKGGKGPADPCVDADECVENDCRTLDSQGNTTFPGFTCTESCCTTDDCSSATFQVGGPEVTFFRICSYHGGMRACSTSNSIVGKGVLSQTCDENADCRSLFCLGGRCSDTCCSDSSCATLEQPGLRCLPTQVVGNWQLRCRLP